MGAFLQAGLWAFLAITVLLFVVLRRARDVLLTLVPLFLSGTNPRVTVYPSGPAFSAGSPAGAVVSNTAKNLKITNAGAASVTVVVALAGGTT